MLNRGLCGIGVPGLFVRCPKRRESGRQEQCKPANKDMSPDSQESRNSILYDSYWGLSILRGLILLFALPFLCSGAWADDPPFKPFVGVGIAEIDETYIYNPNLTKFTGTIVAGEALDVNSTGQAVGWVKLDGDETTHGFYFSPTYHAGDDDKNHIGRLIILDNPTTYDFAEAHAIDNSGGYAVGLAKNTQGYTDAVYWNLSNGECDFIEDLNYPSAAYGVDGFYAVGTHRYGTQSWGTSIMVQNYRNADPDITELHSGDQDDSEGTAYDVIYISGEGRFVVGAYRPDRPTNDYLHAYIWDEVDLVDLHQSSYVSSGAFDVAYVDETYVDIVGYVETSTGMKYPALWEDSGSSFWWFVSPTMMTSCVATGINSYGEIVYTRDNDATGAGLWKRVDGTNYGYPLQSLVLLVDFDPEDDALIHSAHAINDNGWIAGSYKPDGMSSVPMPLLCVPYNVNNNYYDPDPDEYPYLPIPDYREIIEEGGPGNTENDENYGGGREWLLDECEVMRSGMNDVGFDGSTMSTGKSIIHIDKAQIIRQLWKDDHIGTFYISDGEDDVNCHQGAPFLEYWGLGEWWRGYFEGSAVWKEIVITYMHPDPEDMDFDRIPSESGDYTREDFLRNLRDMAYGVTLCIDYIQFGNEHWNGDQRLRLYDICEGGPYTLEEIYDDHNECFDEALGDVKSWYLDQIREARIGSALGGRPLRLFTSAVGRDVDLEAYQVVGGARAWMKFLIEDIANPYEVAIDHHLHYQEVLEVSDRIDIVQSVGHSYWDAPVTTGALEWGPVPDTVDPQGWYANNFENFEDYYLDGDDAPTEWTWNEFVRYWEDEQFSPTGFDFYGVLLDISEAEYLCACYGETIQRGSYTDVFPGDLSALRADKMEDIAFDQSNEWHFTTLMYDDSAPYDSFEEASGDTLIFIGSFFPHPLGCPCWYVCRGPCERN